MVTSSCFLNLRFTNRTGMHITSSCILLISFINSRLAGSSEMILITAFKTHFCPTFADYFSFSLLSNNILVTSRTDTPSDIWILVDQDIAFESIIFFYIFFIQKLRNVFFRYLLDTSNSCAWDLENLNN